MITRIATTALLVMMSAAAQAGAAPIVIKDGTYKNLRSVPNGKPGAYTIVKAEHDGQVIITGDLGLGRSSAYIQFEGLRFESAEEKQIRGHHLKFLRTGFKGGPPSGNTVNTSVGTNDYNDTSDILFEDCWFYGPGGRYDLLVYNSTRVIVRRVVIRHDGGWIDAKGDPEAGLTFYNSTDCYAENVIVLDSNLDYHTWQAAMYSAYNTASPNSNARNHWLGVISLNNAGARDGAGLRFDGNGPQTGHVIQDAVLWDANWGLNLAYQSSVSVTASRLTVGRSAGPSTGVGYGSAGTKAISNVRAVNATVQGASAGATSKPTYLPRQEGGIGASIEHRIGQPGTLVGEPGFDADTGAALWPWPNEARIKAEMCAGVTRGFCADTSLTHYIWNYLGNGVPQS